jgi:hypothetical protein
MKWISASRWLPALTVLGSLLFVSGCSILAPFYFAAILIGMDSRTPPEFHFQEPEDKEKTIRVAVLTYADLNTQIELGHVDRELDETVGRMLAKGLFEEKKKGVEVIKASKVHRWQDEHPDWHSISSEAEIGQRLKADYLVYLEVGNIRFYEEGSNKTLFQGKAEIRVSVVKVDDNEGDVVFPPKYLTVAFPKGRPIPAGNDMSMPQFRRMFLARIAERVCWIFLPHERGDEFDAKDPF